MPAVELADGSPLGVQRSAKAAVLIVEGEQEHGAIEWRVDALVTGRVPLGRSDRTAPRATVLRQLVRTQLISTTRSLLVGHEQEQAQELRPRPG